MEGTPLLKVGDDMLVEGMGKVQKGQAMIDEGMSILAKLRMHANHQHFNGVHGYK